MLRTIIIDDEHRGRSVLRLLLEKFCPDVTIEAEAASVDEGRRLIDAIRPDLVLLDIEMPSKNGFQMLDEIPDRNFAVVFVSAHERYAMKAVGYNAVGYLLKPVDIHELQSAIVRAAAFKSVQAQAATSQSGASQTGTSQSGTSQAGGITVADYPFGESTAPNIRKLQ